MARHDTQPDPAVPAATPNNGDLPPELQPNAAHPQPPAVDADGNALPPTDPTLAPGDPALGTGTDPAFGNDPALGSVDTTAPPETAPTSPAPTGRVRPEPAPHSRVGGVWAAAIAFAVILLLLLIFVLENGQRTEISFFGQHGHLPMGVALLLAAVCGILLVAIPGTIRIIQLRIRDRRHRASVAATPPSVQ